MTEIPTTEEHVWTVAELNLSARRLIEGTFSAIWLEGEISNFNRYPSGHCYFSIKDEDSQIQAVMFQRQAQALDFKPVDGIKVLVHGRVSIFERAGKYQIIVQHMQEKGVGVLYQRFQELKKRLDAEGLFAPEHKKPIPALPAEIGVITSEAGAAIHDVLTVINRRFANVHILLYPVSVQGTAAAGEIATALENLNEYFPGLDVIILGRGGGSIEDLWPFNEEIVARAIYNSAIPVISAVGHEVDYTISDFVADLRAPTPSAAAELVVKSKEELSGHLGMLETRLTNAVKYKVDVYEQRLKRLATSPVLVNPALMYTQYEQQVDWLSQRLTNAISGRVEFCLNEVRRFAQGLKALSPLAVLERGYSITALEKTGEIVTDSAQVEKDDTITVRVHRGSIRARRVEELL